MNTQQLIKSLGGMKIQTGSLVCLGCGYEHDCGVHGCAILREAVAQMHGLYTALGCETRQRKAAVAQLRRMADCDTCKYNHYCGEDGDPCTACTRGQKWEWDGGKPND